MDSSRDSSGLTPILLALSGLALAVVATVSGCGGDEPLLADYATGMSALSEDIGGRLDDAFASFEAEPPSVVGTRGYLAARVAGYEELVEGFNALDPPRRAEELHERIVDLLTRQLAAEKERFKVASEIETVTELDRVWNGPEEAAVRAVEEESLALCATAQRMMDATHLGEGFEDIPWMPSELAEVVTVNFGCPSE